MCVSKRENHAHSDRVFHPLFLPRLSRAWLFRQARSCTSRVKTVPNAARSSGKTSFQPLPVFPTATAAFNGSIVDQLLLFFFFRYFFCPFFFPFPLQNRIFRYTREFCRFVIAVFNSATVIFSFFFALVLTQLYNFVIEMSFLKMWNNRLTCNMILILLIVSNLLC